jgi:hypothetical protein
LSRSSPCPLCVSADEFIITGQTSKVPAAQSKTMSHAVICGLRLISLNRHLKQRICMYKKRKQLEYRQSQLLGGEPAVVDVAGLNYKRCLAIEVPQISAGKSVENKGKQAFEAVTGRWMDCNTHILAKKI